MMLARVCTSVADVQPSATAAGRQDANAAAQQSSNNAEAAAEAEEDRKLLAQREAELDAQKEANMKLQQYGPSSVVATNYCILFANPICHTSGVIIIKLRSSMRRSAKCEHPCSSGITGVTYCRDLQSLQEQIAREAFVPQSNLYQQMQRQLHATREELEKQRQATITLQQERASMQRRQATQELQVSGVLFLSCLSPLRRFRAHTISRVE